LNAETYPYFVLNPWAVTAKPQAPTTLTEFLNAYTPMAEPNSTFQALVSDPTTGLKNYANGFIYFPMPTVDLDETNIESVAILHSDRPFNLGTIALTDYESLTAAYSNFYRWLDFTRFKEGGVFKGLDFDVRKFQSDAVIVE
jgi:hypothetical protein